jgi:hypothetical protein
MLDKIKIRYFEIKCILQLTTDNGQLTIPREYKIEDKF